MATVGIVGGTGYTGSELLRLLAGHPGVEVSAITSRTETGTDVHDLFAHLRGHLSLRFSEPSVATLAGCDVVFFATPNGTAMRMVPELLDKGTRVIDLAADFRLKDPALWERWYGMPHACPALLEEAVYGLPELNRQVIGAARLVANPGCYPTAVALGFAPLIEAGAVHQDWLIADAKSGVSGAGRKAATSLLMAEVGEGFKAYSAAGHRHAPEISQTLAALTDRPVNLTFVPHLVPMVRGIEATLYSRRLDGEVDLQSLYADRYANEPFVDVMPAGAHPETRSVRGANLCRIAVCEQPGGIVIVQSVIDNLVKGAAGQAIQNMNLMLGLEETMGLGTLPLQP